MAKKPVRVFRNDGGSANTRLSVTQQVAEYPQPEESKQGGLSFDRMDGLLESMYDAVLLTDYDGIVFEANTRAEYSFGTTKTALKGVNIMSLISGANEEVLKLVNENAEKKIFTVLEGFCRRGDASMFYAEMVVGRYKGRSEGGLCFFARDITGRKKAEIERKKADEIQIMEERIRARLETLSTLYHEINNPLQILTCMAELDSNKEYSTQLARIVSVMDRLRKEEELDVIEDDDDGPRYNIDSDHGGGACDHNKILVADDEEILRKVFTKALSTAYPNVTIDSASDGNAAVEAFSKGRHALIIMDVSMPSMNGEEAYNSITELCRNNGLAMPRFIFCTGFMMSDRLREIIGDESVHTCLRKPLSIGSLIKVVGEYSSFGK
ncbi:MAG: response regulator [Lentisphaerae bacterium]|nr:response regulator [Lentisphaerota bacterium]